MTYHQRRNVIRILFVVNTWGKRGAEQQLLDLIKALHSHVRPDIFIFTNEKDKYPALVTSRRIKSYSNKYLKKYRFLKVFLLFYLLLKKDYDVVVTEGLGSALFFGRVCAVLRGTPILYSTLHTFHNLHRRRNTYFEMPNRVLNTLLSRMPGKRICRYLPVFKKLTKKIQASINNYSVQTVWNAIPQDYFDKLPNHKPGEKARIVHAQTEGHPTVVQVGVLDDNKNQLFTLYCIKHLKEHIPSIRFLIIGDGDKKAALIKHVRSNHLEKHVIFAGQLNRMDCLYLMSKSNVLVLTSYTEAFPLVFIEAQGCSIPVVSFDVGGASDVIQDGVTGYLTGIGNDQTFMKHLTQLLKNKNLARRMGEMGKQRVLERFTMDRKVEKLLSMIKEDMYALRESR